MLLYRWIQRLRRAECRETRSEFHSLGRQAIAFRRRPATTETRPPRKNRSNIQLRGTMRQPACICSSVIQSANPSRSSAITQLGLLTNSKAGYSASTVCRFRYGRARRPGDPVPARWCGRRMRRRPARIILAVGRLEGARTHQERVQTPSTPSSQEPARPPCVLRDTRDSGADPEGGLRDSDRAQATWVGPRRGLQATRSGCPQAPLGRPAAQVRRHPPCALPRPTGPVGGGGAGRPREGRGVQVGSGPGSGREGGVGGL